MPAPWHTWMQASKGGEGKVQDTLMFFRQLSTVPLLCQLLPMATLTSWLKLPTSWSTGRGCIISWSTHNSEYYGKAGKGYSLIPFDGEDEQSIKLPHALDLLLLCPFVLNWLACSSDDSWADGEPLVKSSNSINLWLEMTVKVSARLFSCGFSSSFQSCQASSGRNRGCGKGNRW